MWCSLLSHEEIKNKNKKQADQGTKSKEQILLDELDMILLLFYAEVEIQSN